MRMSTLFESLSSLLITVLGIFTFVVFISVLLAVIIPMFFDNDYANHKKIWLKNERLWFIPLWVVALALGNLLMAYSFLHTDVYKESVRIVKESRLIVNYVGEPIKFGFFIDGETSSSGGNISYSITGPKQSGKIYANATITANDLKMNYVTFIDGDGVKIEVLKDSMLMN